MNRSNRATLADRVIKAAETSLAAQHYVSSIDVLVGIGWLDRGAVKRWRQGQIDCLEGVVQTNLPRAPELVVIRPLNREWTCHRCGGTGDLLVMENPGPACLRCVGLDDLEFLPAGDALLTRRAKAKSARSAVVVRFSRSRRRYERQGLLVEAEALTDTQRDLQKQRGE
jgi:hypothetical protein